MHTAQTLIMDMPILDMADAIILAAASDLDLPAGIHLRLLRLTMDAETMNSRALQNGRLELA